MPRRNHRHVPAPAGWPAPPELGPDDRVTHPHDGPGRVLWIEWRDDQGRYVDPTSRKVGTSRHRERGAWHALVAWDSGAVSALVPVNTLTRADSAPERIAR